MKKSQFKNQYRLARLGLSGNKQLLKLLADRNFKTTDNSFYKYMVGGNILGLTIEEHLGHKAVFEKTKIVLFSRPTPIFNY